MMESMRYQDPWVPNDPPGPPCKIKRRNKELMSAANIPDINGVDFGGLSRNPNPQDITCNKIIPISKISIFAPLCFPRLAAHN